ncbi:hypothetical protein ZWY2020_009261 [Hordeum vulgare]|nr:hypothetical protein ZWY2020_009261 [Hordeum vulgare]
MVLELDAASVAGRSGGRGQAAEEAIRRHGPHVLLGDLGTGKTSIVVRFAKGLYYECEESTIGVAFFLHALPVSGVGEDATVRFDIWDTVGQERYHSLAPMCYRGAAAAVVVYDITSTDSYTRAKRWVDELQRQEPSVASVSQTHHRLCFLLNASEQEALEYAERNDLFFMETSAKTVQNVGELFYYLGKDMQTLPASSRSASSLACVCLYSYLTTCCLSAAERLVKCRPAIQPGWSCTTTTASVSGGGSVSVIDALRCRRGGLAGVQAERRARQPQIGIRRRWTSPTTSSRRSRAPSWPLAVSAALGHPRCSGAGGATKPELRPRDDVGRHRKLLPFLFSSAEMKAEHAAEVDEMLTYMDEEEEKEENDSPPSSTPIHPTPGTDIKDISDDKS